MEKVKSEMIGVHRHALASASTLALALTLASTGWAETPGCALIDGSLSDGCSHDNAAVVVSRTLAPNASHAPVGELGDLGFSISIDAGSDGPRKAIAGHLPAPDALRAMDRDLDQLGLRVTVDGLGARPMLNVSTDNLQGSYRAGETVRFRSSTNYPAWIARAEVIVTDPERRGTPVAVLPVAANGLVQWDMPATGVSEVEYVLRVYDTRGRYDETAPLTLMRVADDLAEPALTGPVIAAGEAEDRTARRGIPVRGAVVTVSGDDLPAQAQLTVLGEPVIPDLRRHFVMQRILPPGDHDVTITMDNQSKTRAITVPKREFFATGIADITLGRDSVADENWRYGRVAGFAQGVLADGTRVTASVDTRDTELRDMFRHMTRRHPDQVLRQIKDREVWVTTGDDSTVEDLAPTSGRLFLKVENDQSHALWGDFRPEGDLSRVVRTDRTLYGAAAGWRSQDVANDGSARQSVSAYAASTDRDSQRDVFRATGGSAYFLSHRDIESGTETVLVEIRDPVSNNIVSSRRFVEGRDYRIDYVQGVVILNSPLSPTADGLGLVTDSALGSNQVNLVVQYDYVSGSGSTSGDSYGARAEAWVTPTLRFGSTFAHEGAGGASNDLVGGDLMWKRSEDTYLSFEIAQSEGPGFGQNFSLSGGLDFPDENETTGVEGLRARGMRAEGRLDLAEVGAEGYVSAWWDRRDKGFTSPDWNVAENQRAMGLDGRVMIRPETALTFGVERFRDAKGKRDNRARIGVDTMLNQIWQLEAEIAQRDRNHPGSTVEGENGKRTDVAARLTWHRDEDLSVWAFGQSTVSRSGDILRDNRVGVGAQARIREGMQVLAEVSEGSHGGAGRAELAWQPNAGTAYTIGWREDPTRIDSLSSAERRGLIFTGQRQINDDWAYTTEWTQNGVSSRRSVGSTYGVSYTPDQNWRHDFGILSGTARESDGTNIRRTGLSLGTRYSEGEDFAAQVRGEWRRDSSDNHERLAKRKGWLVSGDFTYRTNDDWRVVGALDAVISNGDDDMRDGRYIEAELGYAYRPVDNDRLNALFSYIYLQDLPGADQVNYDGEKNGPKQRSHILNAAMSYDLDQRFTLGLKYGFRKREQSERDVSDFTTSTAHLVVARLDYRVVHKWDALAELRAFHAPKADMTEYGALLGVYREVTPNARIGVGYSWGGVSDDLRKVEAARRGVFVNVIGKF